ncbi:Interferon-induced very large GTPase 1 [Triplophysa tibetana]|uniref:Interferon-induced very large GTPase 1 n=1 Tax=Triplophysa tibetana TaxID=1572043 RepID=A0A5A9N4F6_9TELE|nr:Interferon-induced very large GTPase 1 [Triplophysa tibetana]
MKPQSYSLTGDSFYRKQLDNLPTLCAELLFDGFPLELVDGDASNVPVTWLTSVLSKLEEAVMPNNKIVVVTVLGVQSSGKSTLLNTMFGLQFTVSSGRCTRGAFMQLIRVKDDFKVELNNCDYILIIDTEGLKSPELAQLDNSYEHDNELATLVVGLSDVTIVNIAMENSTEMKDILQIVVHAFLRMKEIGKKHKCLFVHQNVADVSAHDSNMRDRKFLLDQLNDMTQAAAKMENKLEFNKFTDLMEYDIDSGDHYIPGLWHGNPPMAPVNTGYSESVYALKKHIMEIFKRNNKPGNLNEFLTWTESFWNAVKFEKFIFSFRKSLVADAYMKLCIEYNKWEWALRKQVHTWALEAETKILNHGKFDTSKEFNIEKVKFELDSEADAQLTKGEKEIIDKITSYYEQGEGHVELVERYRQDFINSATSLKKELLNLISSKLDAAHSRRNGMIKVEGIKKTYLDTMEKKVLDLLEDCRKTKSNMSDAALDKAFQNMWQETVKTLKILTNGSKWPKRWQFVKEKRESRDDYDDTYITEVLNMIDDTLQIHEDLKVNEESELSLKLHICGFASRDFQDIHKQFILDNDPLKALEKQKETYCSDFIDLFHERDQCQKKADEFTKTCVKPALEKYISVVLATHMADGMLLGENSQVFGTPENRMFKLEEKLIGLVTSEITKAIEETENQDMKGFIQNICKNLKHRLDLPKDAVDRISSLTNMNTKKMCLKCSVNEMVTSMKASLQGDIKSKLKNLQEKPQDVLFKRVQGCGKQCPFCKAPCEAGGEAHSKHFLLIHRPQGLGHCREFDS